MFSVFENLRPVGRAEILCHIILRLIISYKKKKKTKKTRAKKDYKVVMSKLFIMLLHCTSEM